MKSLKVIIILILTLAGLFPVRAQYYSINVDYGTMAAMSEAFTTEAAMEALHNENLQKIRDSYKAAELASAGIFSSKYLDRKALTSLNLWDDRRENYYYNRIYKIVSRRIIPKMVVCAQLMVEDPSTALYWGSYLLKTTEDVKSLCQQFENIVTNSTLSFNDIAFLEISENLKAIFNLANLGGIDWKELLEHLGDDIEDAFTEDNLKDDLDNLINKGVGMAQAGFSNGVDQLLQGTNFGGTFMEKLGSVITLADNIKSMYDQYKDLSATQVITAVIGQDNINSLFKLSDYNLTRWIDDYASAAQGSYYTQRVYIYRSDAGSEILCNYYPPMDENSILYGAEWYRITTTDPYFTPSTAQYETALHNSEGYAGWSRDRVSQLNAGNDGNTYTMNQSCLSYTLRKSKSGQYGKAYAYSIQATKSWNVREEVYEEVFDSYSMDWNTFMAQMNARLAQYNANGDHQEIGSPEDLDEYIATHPSESNYTYYIGYDERSYYQAANAQRVAGAASATFSITCHEGGLLGKGSTTYKCGDCGGSPSSHTKQCSMYTTLSQSSSFDTSGLQSQLTQLQQEAASLQGQIDVLNKENSDILRHMSQASTTEEYYQLQATYNANKEKIKELQVQLDAVNQKITETRNAIAEAEEGESAETDDYNRIPQLMKTMEDAYGISWTDNGSWTGYTFIRNGTVGSVKGTVTFKATVSIARKPKYFLGIKIHRAIVQIDWELVSTWSDSSVAEVMELDPSKSDEENAAIVNRRLSELAQEHPSCTVTVEYAKQPGIETEDTEGVRHLLLASDRLEIARGIEARLARIYTDLVMIEKFLHYKHTVRDWIHDLIPKLNADKDRKMNIAEQSRRRWMHNGGSSYYADEDDEQP